MDMIGFLLGFASFTKIINFINNWKRLSLDQNTNKKEDKLPWQLQSSTYPASWDKTWLTSYDFVKKISNSTY